MCDNTDLFERVKNLNLPRGKYALFGSAPIGVRGLKKCHDADIIVTKDLFDEFKIKEGWTLKKTEKSEYLGNGDIELWKDWCPDYLPGDTWNIEKLISEAEIINELPFVKLEEVLKWKNVLRREKDIQDIEVIENFFQKPKGVTFILINSFGKILMQLRDEQSKRYSNMWCFPGGTVEKGENPLETVIREVKEEYGIDILPTECSELMTHRLSYGSKARVFVCKIQDQEVRMGEGADMKWMSLDGIKKLNLGFEQEKIIPVLQNFLIYTT